MRYIIYIGICTLLLLSGCRRNTGVETGDLIFQQNPPSEMAGAISEATGHDKGEDFTHVGIIIHTDTDDSVLEATSEGGVKLTPMEDFIGSAAKIGGRPAVVVMRLKDTAGVAQSVARARTKIGAAYDYSFRPDNGKFYCSELVEAHYRRPDGRAVFEKQPMNFRAPDGTMPRFWVDLFERLGEEIPEGVPGTNPNDMARSPQLKRLKVRF